MVSNNNITHRFCFKAETPKIKTKEDDNTNTNKDPAGSGGCQHYSHVHTKW